ncbi:MAG: hypothetical protein WBO77_04695 [Microgenomates group bacterium]
MNIYPSILEHTMEDFVAQIENVAPHFSHFQLDIADGLFVPSKTVQPHDLESVDFSNLQGKTVEFHLMVRDYASYIEQIERLDSKLAINRVFIPASESGKNIVSHPKYEIGLVLNPEDTIAEYLDLIMQYKSVQLMTITPGAQGNPFKPEVLNKIDELRVGGYTGEIVLDGGINDVTLKEVVSRKYAPTSVCPGSYFKENVEEHLATLQSIAA